MKRLHRHNGFTIVEILLVVVIIGILLAVIVPRAYRANVDSKYNLVRQGATELAAFAREWGQQQVKAQSDTFNSSLKNYYDSLISTTAVGGSPSGQWVAAGTNFTTNTVPVLDRNAGGGGSSPPTNSVQSLVPAEKTPRNPFNGNSVFLFSNNPANLGTPIPGALALGGVVEATSANNAQYYFIFQGTDSTSTTLGAGTTTFLSPMGLDNEDRLRSGVLLDRAK